MKAAGNRFFVLDGLRGVAALVVMLFHFFPGAPAGLLGHGYLAVDFFFLLSGFVIAWNYDGKFGSGLTLRRFALIRAIRLYPLAMAAVAAAALLRSIYPHPVLPDGHFLGDAAMNLLLLPDNLTGPAERFPFDPPAWSLFFELVVNIVYAIAFPLLGRRVLPVLTVLLGVALAVVTVRHGSVELIHRDIALGCLRTAFSFGFGVLLARSGARSTGRVPDWSLYAALLVVIGAPKWLMPDALYDLLAITVVFPLIVRAGATRAKPHGAAVERELGELSYPVYILHMPILTYVGVGLGHFVRGPVIAVAASIIVPVVAAAA